MIESPSVVKTAPRLFAALRLTIAKAEIQSAMGPGLQAVHSALSTQGIAAAGPWFTHHHRIDPHEWDFEICVPVPRPIAAEGRVTPGEWPAMKVARATHQGGYEGLGAAWEKLDAWIAAQKLSPQADLWEVYSVGPESSADPGAWRTELNRPLREGK